MNSHTQPEGCSTNNSNANISRDAPTVPVVDIAESDSEDEDNIDVLSDTTELLVLDDTENEPGNDEVTAAVAHSPAAHYTSVNLDDESEGID